MKRIWIIALTLALVLSLTACGSGSEGGNGDSSGGGSGDSSGSDASDAWDDAQDWAHAQGWDGEGYLFPQVDSMHEWPPASLWAELGLPDMTPAQMENGEIYNDGNVHVDGYSDTFVAQCNTGEDTFHALAEKLWNAGIKGVNPGSGRIIPAEDMDWLIEDDPNYLWYRAYYEHEGDIMEVYLQYTNGWDTILWVGVTFAPSDPDFAWMPKVSWPASEIKSLSGVDLPNPGGTVYGNVLSDADYPTVELIIEGVPQTDYDSYIQNLKDGSVPIVLDENGSSWGFYNTYGHAFYPENHEEYAAYIDVNYASGLLFITVYTI